MKTILLILLITVSTTIFANELSWVDEQVEAIKPPRNGMKNKNLAKIKSPFIFLSKNNPDYVKPAKKPKSKSPNQVKSKKTAVKNVKTNNKIFTITMIMNKSARINGSWYKYGDTINGYKVIQIDKSSVLLAKNKKQLLLSTKSSSKNLKFKNK